MMYNSDSTEKLFTCIPGRGNDKHEKELLTPTTQLLFWVVMVLFLVCALGVVGAGRVLCVTVRRRLGFSFWAAIFLVLPVGII